MTHVSERPRLRRGVALGIAAALLGGLLASVPTVPAAADTSTIEGRKQTMIDAFAANDTVVDPVGYPHDYCKHGLWYANAKLEADVDVADAVDMVDWCITNQRGYMFMRWAIMDIYFRHADAHFSPALKAKYLTYWSGVSASGFSGPNNLRLMEAVSMYLAVQEFPTMTGAATKLAQATAEINGHLATYPKYGMEEFGSATYGAIYMGVLTTLRDHAADAVLANKASMVLDWMYLAQAQEWFDGYWVTTSTRDKQMSPEPGRSTGSAVAGWIQFGGRDPVLPDVWLAENNFAMSVALSDYSPSQVIIDIATDRSVPLVTRAGHDQSNTFNPPNGYNKYTYVTDVYGMSSFEDGIDGSVHPTLIWETNRWKLRWASDDRASAFFMKNSLDTNGPYIGAGAMIGSTPVYSQLEQVVQHEGTLLAVYNLPSGITRPYIEGPVSQDSIYRTEETGGWIFFHGGSIVFGVRIAKSYTWEAPQVLEDWGTGVGRTWDTLRSTHLKNGVIVEVKPTTDYDSPSDVGLPEAQRLENELDRFIADVTTNTVVDITGIDNANPTMSFTNLDGDTVFITHNGTRGVNSVPYDYANWPLIDSAYAQQAVNGDLTINHGSTSCTYDFDAWTTDCPPADTGGGSNNPPAGGGGDEDLRIHWSLDEGAGTATGDWSYNGRTGTMVGGLAAGTDSVTGKYGAALDLDGSDDTVRFDNAPGIGAYPFTLSAWVKTSTSTGEQTLVFAGDHTEDDEFASISVAAGRARITAQDGATPRTAEWATSIADGQWHLVTGVFESATSMRLYVDGTHRSTQTTSVAMPDIDRVSVGSRDSATPGAFLTGAVDDVRVYDTALAANDVSSLYASTDPSLALHWPFNAPSGTYATDFSGNGNDGSLLNGLTSGTDTVTGKFVSALDFDGVDDVVRLGGSPVHAYPFTVSGWINTTSTTGNRAMVFLGDPGSTNVISVGLTNGFARLSIKDAVTTQHAAYLTSVADGNWHSITAVFESATSMKLYVDGVLRATQTVSVAVPDVTRVSVGLVDRTTATDPFLGAIDDVRIYKRALNATEVAALFTP